MKIIIIFILLLKITFLSSQELSGVIFSTDCNHVVSYGQKLSGFTKSKLLNLYGTDNLNNNVNRYILKEDSLFCVNRLYEGQRGYFYYEDDKKSNFIIYDTLLFNDFCILYKIDTNNLIYPEIVQFEVDTVRIKREKINENVKFCRENKTAFSPYTDVAYIYKLIYKDIVIYTDTLTDSGNYIINSLESQYSQIFIDRERKLYLFNASVESAGCYYIKETYEIHTTLSCRVYFFINENSW